MVRFMSAPLKIAGFAAVLCLVFAGAALAGRLVDPGVKTDEAGGHGGMASGASADVVRGLSVAEDGLRLTVADPELQRGRRETLRFAIVDGSGAPVRDFDVAHERRMHLIIVRRDLSGFQHLHPTQAADGTWSVPVRLPEAGSYRVFADFTRHGKAHTLATDLRVDGPADLAPLPAPATTARTDGYEVRLQQRGNELGFEVTRDGEPVRTEPYLGAGGHMVALREGDLAFLHVHAEDGELAFETSFPTPDRYRLFLQFKHAGSVHTAAFTVDR
jgi:hypothetical protein